MLLFFSSRCQYVELLKGLLCKRRLFTRALRGIIPVCRKPHAPGLCTIAVALECCNVAVANTCSVLLPVTYSAYSKDFQGIPSPPFR